MSTQTTLRALIEASKAPAKTKQAWLTLLEDEMADLPMDAPAEPNERPAGTPHVAWNCLCYTEPVFRSP